MVFAAVCVVLTVALGTLVALLLRNLGRTWRAIVISAIMVAWAMPAVTGTYVWVWIFDPRNGIVTAGAEALGLVEQGGHNWFTDRLSFYAIVALNVIHHGFPFVAVTVLAGLLTCPTRCSRPRRWTAPAPGGGSGTSPCR